MKPVERVNITVEATINAPVDKVWEYWTDPKHITGWNYASEDWFTPRAENDLRPGGRFLSRMEEKNGSIGFDFTGIYKKVKQHKLIEYTIDDGRNVLILFKPQGNVTTITETFEAENIHPAEMQQAGWQSILNNFKMYVEESGKFEKMQFEISIKAGSEKVYHTMLDEQKWKEWTSEFNPTSHFIGSWEKGSKILFLGTGQDGNIGGMTSRIKENIPNRFISIEHIGIVHEGKEITNSTGVTDWAGALENYTFTEINGSTLLTVVTDTDREFMSYFSETWPKALLRLKEICEK